MSSGACELSFKIDRDHADTHTPYRNPDIDKVTNQLGNIQQWARSVRTAIRSLSSVRCCSPPCSPPHCAAQLDTVDKPSLDFQLIDARDDFVPIMPVMEERAADAVEAGAAGVESSLVESSG